MSDIVNYLVMIFLVGIQSYYYFKVSPSTLLRMPVVVATTTFSMILTPMLMVGEVVGTPFIQIFFMVYQILIFFFSMFEYVEIKKSG